MGPGIKSRYGSNNYRGKQSDDDYQRGNARHHGIDGRGQDRFRQEVAEERRGPELYIIEREEHDQLWYFYLRGVERYAPYDGKWVRARDVRNEPSCGRERVVRVRMTKPSGI